MIRLDSWFIRRLTISVREDSRYKAMVSPEVIIILYLNIGKQIGSLPSELFSDFVEDLEERFYKDKKRVKELLKVL
jgi:hypothetical protein